MGDTNVRFGMPSSFARKEQFFRQQSEIGVSEKFLQSSSVLFNTKIDNKTQNYQNLHKTKNLTKSNTCLNQLRILNPSKTLKTPEVERIMTGGGYYKVTILGFFANPLAKPKIETS